MQQLNDCQSGILRQDLPKGSERENAAAKQGQERHLGRTADPKKNMKVLASKAVDAYKEEVESYLAKRFPNGKKKAKKKNEEAFNEYFEATEFVNTPYPVVPKANTIFAEKH